MTDVPPTSPSNATTFGAHDPTSTSCTCNSYISDARHRLVTTAAVCPDVVNPGVVHVPITEEFQPLTSFTLFPELPQELRDHIWAFASFLPRDVPVFTAAVSPNYSDIGSLYLPYYQIISSQPAPPILHASREARLEGLKHYKLIFKVHYTEDDVRHDVPPRMYFNTEADRLCVFGPLPAEVYDRIEEGIVSEGIRKVAMNTCVTWGESPSTGRITVNGSCRFLSRYRRKKWLDSNIRELVYYYSTRFIQRSDKIQFVEADGKMPAFMGRSTSEMIVRSI